MKGRVVLNKKKMIIIKPGYDPMSAIRDLSEEGFLGFPHDHGAAAAGVLQGGDEGPGAQGQAVPSLVVPGLVDRH